MDFRLILLIAPVMLFSVIAHEIAHGYAALRQGDTTARDMGRLTWNPIKHIDLWLTIILPVILFQTMHMAIGGAKPVPVDPRNYRNYRRGDIIVSLAGVATNLVIAIACTILAALIGLAAHAAEGLVPVAAIAQAMMLWAIYLNLGLVAFNLIPVPPLDGSHVVKYLLPPAWAAQYQRIGFAGIVLLILMVKFNFLDWWFKPVELAAQGLFHFISRLVLPETTQDWFR
ncbi:MAG TPA: site-2 protease family protein [Gemmatimonadaceae bacterium]|nr:site-2 protease family protein [Gemmatimonadaceae bacterium]